MESIKSSTLDKVYKNERNANVKERILLVIRGSVDNQPIESVAQELHRSRAWAFKWYKRYNDEGLDGLKDKPRSGKPTIIPKEMMDKIKIELSGSNMGWDFRQVSNIIQKRTGVKYHRVHIYRLLHKWGFVPKMPQKKFVRTATLEEKKGFKKGYKMH